MLVGAFLLSFVICALIFGLLHLYQRWVGVLAATVLGLVFATLYVLSGSLLLVIALHALIDLRSLVLLPWLILRAKDRKERADAAAAAAAASAESPAAQD